MDKLDDFVNSLNSQLYMDSFLKNHQLSEKSFPMFD